MALFLQLVEAHCAGAQTPIPLVISPQDKISIEASDAKVTDLLDALFQANPGVNKVYLGKISGVVSINLQDVAWEAALKYVCELAGLHVRKDPNNIYVIQPLPKPLTPPSPATATASPPTPIPSPPPSPVSQLALPFLDMSAEVVSLFGLSTFSSQGSARMVRRDTGLIDLNALSMRTVTREFGGVGYVNPAFFFFNGQRFVPFSAGAQRLFGSRVGRF
jgi:hypothetical protein